MTINVEFDDNGVISINKSGVQGGKYIRRVYQDELPIVVAGMDLSLINELKEKLDELSQALDIRLRV